tara:strand:+ start:3492 stop:3662 length:171 start_codon:yes stop_codon:yes gene_type:complete
MAAKDNKIMMKSEESHYFFTICKSAMKEKTAAKLRLRRYDPVIGKHCWFKESKIKK